MKILVTGAAGMIGRHLTAALTAAGHTVIGVDKHPLEGAAHTHVVTALDSAEEADALVAAHAPERIIHLAALAHTAGERDLSFERYRHVNVTVAEHIFAAAGNIPVLFISTADVYGFAKGKVTASTPTAPVTHYAKSKLMAETACARICPHYTIFRLQPVYTDTVKRDIRKRYYLKYPHLAYTVGKGASFEALSVHEAAARMVAWCESEPQNDVHIIKDSTPCDPRAMIAAEKAAGRARLVLPVPRPVAVAALAVAKALTGKNKWTYLLNKAVYPLKTE